jgi:hypothetical protein
METPSRDCGGRRAAGGGGRRVAAQGKDSSERGVGSSPSSPRAGPVGSKNLAQSFHNGCLE